jgi:hypothetical protein
MYEIEGTVTTYTPEELKIDRRLAAWVAGSTGLNQDSTQALPWRNRPALNESVKRPEFPVNQSLRWICNSDIGFSSVFFLKGESLDQAPPGRSWFVAGKEAQPRYQWLVSAL